MPILRSNVSDVEVPLRTIWEEVFQDFHKFPDHTALVCGETGRSYTFRQIPIICRNVASGLYKLGIRKGDTVALLLPNLPEYPLALFGSMMAGATVTTINPAYTATEIGRQLQDSGSNLLITIPQFEKTAKQAVKKSGRDIKHIVSMGQAEGCTSFQELAMDDGSQCPKLEFDYRNDVAVLPYSSGTTGVPKGVMLTHYNVVGNMTQMSHPDIKDPLILDTTDEVQEVAMAVLPFFHSYGLFVILCLLLKNGQKIICMPRFVPEVFLSAIEKYKISIMPLVPPVVLFLSKSPLVKNYDLSSVKKVGSGAAPLSSETEEEFKRRMGVTDLGQGYGLTETSPCVSSGFHFLPKKPGASGYLMPSTEIQIIDLSTAESLGPNKRGEIWIRGPQVMKGYWNKPEATRNTVDTHGWLHTGDVGYYDDDGAIYVVDRIKELIKYKGFQVAPAEMEALLLTHQAVADAGVIGLPDLEAGELPTAFVVKKPAASGTAEHLHAFTKENAASFKQFKGGIFFLDQIPKTQSGKILRRDLREMAKKMRSKL